MRHSRMVIGLVSTLLFILVTTSVILAQEVTQESTQEVLPVVQPATATPPPATNDLFYTVLPNDNLFRIALRFGKTTAELAQSNGITNPALIYTGQQIRIPGVLGTQPPPVVVPTATTPPVPTGEYVVQRGDTLYKIAVRFNTTVSQLIALNSIPNPNIIYTGQTIKVPDTLPTIPDVAVVPTAVVDPTDAPPSDTAPVTQPEQIGGGEAAPAPTGYGYAHGVQAYLVDQDVPALTGMISDLGVTWVKQEILWRDFEPVQGQIDFDTLDEIVNTLRGQNLNILFTVSAAPSWARASTDENGPPDNFADYGTFLGALASRYAGQVQAYEIWNEPNLRREWNSTIYNISAASYIDLLRVGYNAVKAADSSAVVVSAGLAPTGFNDGVNAINDRLFLASLYMSGFADISDAVGAHPLGWANPPDSVCCSAPVGVETHFQDSSFYFKETLNAYRDIMVSNNDGSTAIWVTKFGWGTSEDTDPPSETNIFVSYTTLGEQAVYDPRAFEVGAELGFVGPMFLNNLNACLVQLTSIEDCYYSLMSPSGSPRPVFAAIQEMSGETSAPPPVPTAETIEQPTAESLEVVPTFETATPLPLEVLPTNMPAPEATPEVSG